MKNYPFFPSDELVCKCCGQGEMNDEFMKLVIEARREAKIAFIVNSGYRCPKHDAEEGGGKNHTTGKAIDIKAKDKLELATIAFSLIRAGIVRIGISYKPFFVHADMNLNHPYPRIWVYERG